ncbi:hypothetical protein WJX75_009929 [Coccomyxa subellipsoidea]|uniref:Polyglutamine-binding protein 1 n=1 Tax=Coccomyxa subellipsoidea TaxID=248742 RepID=A0ABR2YBW2_9CHLO
MAGRGRDRVLPAWMAGAGNGVPPPPGPPSTSSNNWADVDQIATAAVLQEQDAELRATLAQQSGQKRDFGEVERAQTDDPALAKDKLLRMTHEIRGDRPGAADASRERGAGDWQHYKPPSAVLKEVAARNAQPRLGPRLPGPPPLQPPGPRRPPGPPPIQAPSQRQPDAAAAHMQPPAPPGGFAPGPQAHLGQPPSSSPHIGSADLSQQGPYGRSSQPNGAEAPPGQVAIRKEPSLERTTSNSSNGAAEAAASTPTELQRQRRPSYFAKPVIRAAPTPASQPEQPAPAMPNQASQAAPAPVKALPPLLLARLAKRGILPQADTAAPASTSTAAVHVQPAAAAAPAAVPAAAAAPMASGSEPLPEGWSQAVDPTYNHPYWYNVSTGERSWGAASGVAKAPPPPKPSGSQLPPGWSEAADPGTGLPYYFNAATGQTQWEHPTAAAGLSGPFVPSATFTGRAEGYVFKMGSKGLGYYQDTGPFGGEAAAAPLAAAPAAAMQVAAAASAESRERLNRREVIAAQQERRHAMHASRRQRDEIDPMDPSAYSDAPLGGWSSGMEGAQPRAADTTASGPLFQQRPYPAPGSVLRANQKLISGEPQIGPAVPRK